jgi:hypothetical protein
MHVAPRCCLDNTSAENRSRIVTRYKKMRSVAKISQPYRSKLRAMLPHARLMAIVLAPLEDDLKSNNQVSVVERQKRINWAGICER